jgi:hypothetical protein
MKKVELDIRNEMVKQDKNLHDTTAGKTLKSELAQERERLEQREAQARAQYKRALRQKQDELARVLQEQEEELKREAKKRDEDLEKLKMSLRAADIKAENERRKREKQEQEQERLRRFLDESRTPKSRSHPGPNRIQECRSITLVGNSFFFCGPDTSER